MRTLTRKVGEGLIIPACDLVVTVLELHGDRVRLGIEAPPALQVQRQDRGLARPTLPPGTLLEPALAAELYWDTLPVQRRTAG
jgi:hypothetical protein